MRAKILHAFVLCVVLCLSLPLSAVLADYTFSASNTTYTEITGGTVFGTETSDDQRFVDPTIPAGGTVNTGVGLPIGFNFTFNDYVFDVIAINNNGWISFGQSALGTGAVNITSSSSYTPIQSTSVITPAQLANRVVAFARDLQSQTGASLRLETIGTAPNRVCVVQWKNYKRYSTTGTGDILNFQIRLYETTNKVQIAYGAFTAGTTTSSTVQVGMRGADVTDFANRTTTTDWTLTSAGAVNTATCTFVQGVIPPNGLIFDYNAPVPATNDLQAMTVTGSIFPSVGAASNYTVTVRNRGSNQQTNYQVKLMQGTTEIATVAGPTIAPMQLADVVIPWTPTTTGETALTGMVVLAGDENTLNDISSPLSVNVYPAGTLVTVIGTGTSAAAYPFYTTYGYARHATLYTAAELTQPGLISGVMWKVVAQYGNVIPYRILLKNTTATALIAEPWATTITDAQECVSDTVTIDQLGWKYFPFTTPYFYSGDNLMVMVEANYGGTGTSSNQTFNYTAGTTGSAHYWGTDTNPPTTNGTLTANKPNIGITFQMGGMGSLAGTVTSGGNPLDGATVTILTTPFTQLTGAAGTYNFPFVSPGTYQVTCSKLGYMTQTQEAVITVSNTTTLNFAMEASAQVNVTGTVVGSDAPTVGLANATIDLDGPIDYTATTNASGQFTITGVLAGNTYNYVIARQGYQNATGSITVGASNYNMGTVTLNEIAIQPGGVTATLNNEATAVNITWRTPGAGSANVDNFDVTDGGWVPTSSWSNPLGDWQWTANYNPAVYTDIDTYVDVPPTSAHSGTGMWGTVIQGGYTNATGWSYLRKTFNLSGISDPVINLWHYMDGYNTWDYGLIKVNGNTVWGSSSAAEFMPWQVLNVDLTAYANQSNVEISFEWYATGTVSYAGWYIDDVYVGSATGVPPARADRSEITAFNPVNNRSLLGYKVWRLQQGQETNEASWTVLTTNVITDTTYTNSGWQSLPDGEYKWAVKSVYTGNVMSNASFSNVVRKRPNDLSATAITGTTTPSVGSAFNYTVTVVNTGTADQIAGAYTVKVMSGMAELASVAGPAIAAGETQAVIVPWTPTLEGSTIIYGKVVLTTDTQADNDSSPTMTVNVQPLGTMFVTIGEGTSTQRYPLGTYYGYERDASLYFASEFNGVMGRITGVQWYATTQYGIEVPYKIYLKNTSQTAMVAQPWDQTIADATLMVQGTRIINQTGWNYFPFPDSSNFVYLGENLIVMVETNYGGSGTSSYPLWTYTTSPTASHHYMYADTNPPTTNGYTSASRPNIGISLTAGGTTPMFIVSPTSAALGQVLINTTTNKTFTITNAGGGTTPLVINSITISGSPYFTLQNLPTLPASLNSFQSTTFVARYNPTTAGEHAATITITDNLARSYTYEIGSGKTGNTRTQHLVQLSATAVDVTIYTLPYFQNFDAVSTPNLPVDWNKLFTSPGNVTTSTTSPHSTPNCVYISNSTSTAGPYLLAPPIASTIPMNTVRVRFWGKGSNYVLSVGITADPLDAATYEQTQTITLTSTWTEYVVGFQTYAGTGRYVTFKHGNASTSQSIYVDDVMLEIIADNDLAATALTGPSSPSLNSPSTYTVSLTNWGSLAQSNYQVKLMNGDTELASVPGPQINPGANADVTVNWTPTAQGALVIYGKVVLTGDQNNLNDNSPTMNIFIHPAGTLMVEIGNGTSTQRQPMGTLYGYERDASLYTSDQINLMGRITGVQWYASTQYGNSIPYKIYLKSTTETAMTAIPWATMLTDAQLAVEDTITVSQTGWIYLPFTNPYIYLGGNLIVLVETNYGGAGTTSSQYFRYTTGTTGCHQYWYADTSAPTGNGYLNTNRPNIGLSFTAIDTQPAFAITPTAYNYGQTFMNITYDKAFTLINIGGGTNPLIINSISITGSPYFTLQNLPVLPLSLTSFQTAAFTTRYLPTAIGTHTATITITDNLNRSFSYQVGRDREGTRTQHLVELSATCIDPTIYTSPYFQNFDTVTAPALPIDWTPIATSPQILVTYATSPNSAPNCVRIYNSTTTSGPYLVSPPISSTLPLNTMRIKFWAKGSTSMQLAVGGMSNPQDTGTFSQVASVPLTSSWAEYVVGFQTYTGNGQFMAFKHGNASTSQYIYLDDVTIEVTPNNDLAAISLQGNSTPSVGVSYNYTVNLFNWGINPQSTYTVNLCDAATNAVLTSTPGTLIEPGMAGTITVPWVPTTVGPMSIYAKLVLTGDQNNLNDQTPSLMLNVQPAGTVVITIGEGTSTQRQPFGAYYGYERDATLISGTQIGLIGMITGFQWYVATANAVEVPFKIYIKPTTDTALTATSWDSMVAGATLVKTDTLAFSQTGWVPIELDNPYVYLSGNFLILVETFYGGAGVSSYPYFRYTSGQTGTHMYWYADTNPPTNNGTVNANRPNVAINMIPGGVGHLTGTVYGAGNLPLANTTIQILNGATAMTNAQGVYNIMNIIADTISVTASRYGYLPQTASVIIVEDSTVTQNFTLQQMPTSTSSAPL